MKKKEVRIALMIAEKIAANVYETIEETEKSIEFFEAFEKAGKKIDEYVKKQAGDNMKHLETYEKKAREFSGRTLDIEMKNYLKDKKGVKLEDITILQGKLIEQLDKLHEPIMPKITKEMTVGVISGLEYKMIREYIEH